MTLRLQSEVQTVAGPLALLCFHASVDTSWRWWFQSGSEGCVVLPEIFTTEFVKKRKKKTKKKKEKKFGRDDPTTAQSRRFLSPTYAKLPGKKKKYNKGSHDSQSHQAD